MKRKRKVLELRVATAADETRAVSSELQEMKATADLVFDRAQHFPGGHQRAAELIRDLVMLVKRLIAKLEEDARLKPADSIFDQAKRKAGVHWTEQSPEALAARVPWEIHGASLIVTPKADPAAPGESGDGGGGIPESEAAAHKRRADQMTTNFNFVLGAIVRMDLMTQGDPCATWQDKVRRMEEWVKDFAGQALLSEADQALEHHEAELAEQSRGKPSAGRTKNVVLPDKYRQNVKDSE